MLFCAALRCSVLRCAALHLYLHRTCSSAESSSMTQLLPVARAWDGVAHATLRAAVASALRRFSAYRRFKPHNRQQRASEPESQRDRFRLGQRDTCGRMCDNTCQSLLLCGTESALIEQFAARVRFAYRHEAVVRRWIWRVQSAVSRHAQATRVDCNNETKTARPLVSVSRENY